MQEKQCPMPLQVQKQFLTTEKKASYADVYSGMLKADGSPMEDIFLEDKLHMNARGYAIWQKLIEPYLIKQK
jgi:lysophospholipase L1-like esterase